MESLIKLFNNQKPATHVAGFFVKLDNGKKTQYNVTLLNTVRLNIKHGAMTNTFAQFHISYDNVPFVGNGFLLC